MATIEGTLTALKVKEDKPVPPPQPEKPKPMTDRFNKDHVSDSLSYLRCQYQLLNATVERQEELIKNLVARVEELEKQEFSVIIQPCDTDSNEDIPL